MPDWVYVVGYGVLGGLVGSALSQVAERAPRGEAWFRPRAHCPACRTRLAGRDMLPVISFLALRGRCRTCGARIPRRDLWVELVTAALFALFWVVHGPSVRLFLGLVYASLLVVTCVIDIEHHEVLHSVMLPAIALAVLFVPLLLVVSPSPSLPALLRRSHISPQALIVLNQFLGGLSAFGIYVLIWVASPTGMGLGDVELAAFVGLIVGYPASLVAVFISFILGGVTAVLLLALGKARRDSYIPYAPFLVVGALLMLLWGEPFLAWYALH